MKKFIINSIYVSIITLAFGLVLETELSFIDNEYSYKRRYLEKNGNAIKVLVLGHSHALNGINPAVMGDSVFNMAIAGRPLYYDAVIAERYLHTLPNLSIVIWPFGYDFQYDSYIYPNARQYPNKKLVRSQEADIQCMYEKYMNISYEPHIQYQHWSAIIYHRNNFTDFLKPHVSCEKNGSFLLEKSGDLNKPGLSSIDYSNQDTPKAFQEGIDNMKRIAAACRDSKVRLIVVWFPYYKTARVLFTNRGMKERSQCLDSMRSVYPSMEYLNYSDDERFDAEDFSNPGHLNKRGADKISRILKDTLGI